MTAKDFSRFAWEEQRVERMQPYTLYYEYRNSPFDIYPVNKDFPRDYDELNINWREIDFTKELQEIGKELFNKYK